MNPCLPTCRSLPLAAIALSALAWGCSAVAPPPPSPPPAPAVGASQLSSLLLAGDLEGAERVALPLAAAVTSDPQLALEVGRLHLLRNELALAEQWLPKPHILHPYPAQRLRVTTRGKSPVR